MNTALQTMIDQANRKTAASRRQVFGKKANDQQHHENLLKHVDVVLDALQSDIKAGLVVSNNLREAIRELNAATTLSRRRLQS